MEGVANTIKEFSEDFDSLYNVWKYSVEQEEDSVSIKYMEKKDNKWEEMNSININFSCANKLFKEIAKAFEKGDFAKDY